MISFTTLILLIPVVAPPLVSGFFFHNGHHSRGNTFLLAKSSVKAEEFTHFNGASVIKESIAGFISASLVVGSVVFGSVDVAFADGSTKEFKLPPIDFSDKSRCVIANSKMGQANAARDKLFDLRQCKLSGADASGYDLSGVILTDTDLSGAKLLETQFSKGYLHDSIFDGADFSNGIVDRASFKGSSLKGAIFINAVLTGTSFEGADLTNTDFTDTYLGDFDSRSLCRNPTLSGENPTTGADSRLSAGNT